MAPTNRLFLESLECRRLLAVDFLPTVNYALELDPWDVAVGDFNGDGNDDLAASGNDIENVGNHVSVLLGNSLGGFAAATNFAVGERR